MVGCAVCTSYLYGLLCFSTGTSTLLGGLQAWHPAVKHFSPVNSVGHSGTGWPRFMWTNKSHKTNRECDYVSGRVLWCQVTLRLHKLLRPNSEITFRRHCHQMDSRCKETHTVWIAFEILFADLLSCLIIFEQACMQVILASKHLVTTDMLTHCHNCSTFLPRGARSASAVLLS